MNEKLLSQRNNAEILQKTTQYAHKITKPSITADESSRRSQDNDTNSIDGVDVPDCAKRNSLRSTSSFCDEVFFEDESTSVDTEGGCASITTLSAGADEDIFKYQSRLSMLLPGIVGDQNCLSYFVQYLEAKNELPLIKFYLDTENFRAAALTQLDIEQNACAEPDLEHNSRPPATDNAENDDNNKVPELKTLCDLSMRKPLTDDEKSQIYAETNKQITKCAASLVQSSPELSLCGEASTESLTTSMNGSLCATVSIKDAMSIYQKYLIPHAQQFVTLPVAILSQISLLLCKRDDSNPLPISADCFAEAQHYVLTKLEEEFLSDFLQSTFYCKYCIELIESANSGLNAKLNINDILYSEVTLFFFMEFLEQHHERDCLDFWTAAINFRKSYCSNEEQTASLTSLEDENDAQSDAMIIYEKYFSLQSESRLWMSDRLRCKVEESICAAGKVGNCFDLPLIVTAKYLEQKYLDNFLSSQLFENYLNELKLKVNEDATKAASQHSSIKNSNNSHHRKTMSDCTNEGSRALFKHISQHNTLLAMESHTHQNSQSAKLQQSTATSNFSIDTRQLANPSMLWQRKASTAGGDGLKFGKINPLGRYERDFDSMDALPNAHKPHSWSLTMGGNKIRNAMRKLVNLPEDKVQEEIAWQVAEMIVKDVTTVTLSDGK